MVVSRAAGISGQRGKKIRRLAFRQLSPKGAISAIAASDPLLPLAVPKRRSAKPIPIRINQLQARPIEVVVAIQDQPPPAVAGCRLASLSRRFPDIDLKALVIAQAPNSELILGSRRQKVIPEDWRDPDWLIIDLQFGQGQCVRVGSMAD